MSFEAFLIALGIGLLILAVLVLTHIGMNRYFDSLDKREAQGFSDPVKDPSDPIYHEMEPVKEEAKEADKDDMRPRGDW